MTRRRKLILVAAAVVGAGVLAGGAALAARTLDDEDPGELRTQEAFTQAHVDEAVVNQADAEAIATDAHAGNVVAIHLENDGPGLHWEIEVDDGQAVWEVNVDARTGAVLDSEADDHGGPSDDDSGAADDDLDGSSDD